MLEFASAVINIWEKKIFSQQDQERMLKAPDEKAAFAVLFDTDLAGFAVKEKNFEILANKDIEETRRKLAAVLKEEPLLLTLLFLKFDCLHLKIILKRFFGLADFETEPIIFQPSNLPFTSLESLTNDLLKERNRDYSENEIVSDMVKIALDLLKNQPTKTSSLIERSVDRAFLTTKIKYSTKYPLLKNYVQAEIDLSNLRAVLKKEALFIQGGNFNQVDLEKMAQLKEGEVMRYLSRFAESFGLSLILEDFKKEQSESLLEVRLKTFLSEIAQKEARKSGAGVAKVLNFFQRKINCLNNINLILFSKRAGLAVSEVEPLLLPI